jgi:hypothetical protein
MQADTRRFFLNRGTTHPSATAEDRAAAFLTLGTFTGYAAARAGLLAAIAAEFTEWQESAYDADWACRLRLATLAAQFARDPEARETAVDGLRFWLWTTD